MFSDIFVNVRDMRIQFGSLLADIGLIDLPKKSQVPCFYFIGLHISL